MQRAYTFAALAAVVQQKLSTGSKQPMIVDVRDVEEVAATGTIPTAVHLPLAHFDRAFPALGADEGEAREAFHRQFQFEKPAKDEEIIFYCLRGMRAQKAQATAIAAGYDKAAVYPGSWDEWSKLSKK